MTRTRTTFTFAKAAVARQFEHLAQASGCTIQELMNEALEQFVRTDVTQLRDMCAELVSHQGRLLTLLERGGKASPAFEELPPPVFTTSADPLPAPTFAGKNPWEM